MEQKMDKYQKDFERLKDLGLMLQNAIQLKCYPEESKKQIKDLLKEKASQFIKNMPNFKSKYQAWYSESKVLIRQLLPDRVDDFVRYYEKPKSRKEITYENYTIEDYLQGLTITRGFDREKIVGPDAAIPKYNQQVAILSSLETRFSSLLYDIRLMVQGDLFESELEASRELLKHRYVRSAGALAGVVLERHLKEACANHKVKIQKKNPSISDYNEALKGGSVIDVPTWRFIQHLGDIRNLCDHSKEREPKSDQVVDLIDGVQKITKTLF